MWPNYGRYERVLPACVCAIWSIECFRCPFADRQTFVQASIDRRHHHASTFSLSARNYCQLIDTGFALMFSFVFNLGERKRGYSRCERMDPSVCNVTRTYLFHVCVRARVLVKTTITLQWENEGKQRKNNWFNWIYTVLYCKVKYKTKM